MHVIILDDDPAIGAFVARVAKGAGWTAEVAQGGPAFQRAVAASRADLIFLDLLIGDTDGVEQLRFLSEAGYDGPIALLSGVDGRVLESALHLGADLDLRIIGALSKPMSLARLREVLAAAAASAVTRDAPAQRSLRPIWTAADVGRALAAEEMQLHLQPVVSAANGEAVGFEGLIRWDHPRFGLVPPNDFIPQAEGDDAVIDALTMWVAGRALGHFKQLRALGLAQPIAINVSSANFSRLDFPDRLAALVAAHGLEPEALSLEMTETMAMRDPRATIDVLTRLRLKGFAVALDDFGAGYSSLVALVRMPFTAIKVDRLFVEGLASSRERRIVAAAVIRLARDLEIASIAEGVETAGAAEMLRAMGADRLQGYFYSRPLAFDQLVGWLAARKSGHAVWGPLKDGLGRG